MNMRNILIFLVFAVFFVSCSNEDPFECITAFDCDEGFVCIDGYCVDDGIGDTGNSGNTGDSGNSGDTGDSGNSGNTGDTSIPDEDTVIVDNEMPDIVNDDNVEHDDDVNPEQDEDVIPDEDNAITCNNGYESNGTTCVDINECVKGTHNCHVNADCANTEGSFTCTCKTNYSGNGVTCTPDTRSNQACSGLPENAQWNTAAVINQTWNGSDWIPSTIGTYNVDSSLTECRFICKTNFGWNGSVCTAELRYDQACTGLPSNASWNTASSITQAWSGSTWLPTTTGVYNETASDAECRYKCNADYHWDISSCVSNTRTNQTCTGLPANAEWNTVSNITQTWNGSTWIPSTAATYNETASTIDCRYKCNTDYHLEGVSCVSNTRTQSCTGLPANASWNTVSSITQTWNGSSWTPLTAGTYNTTGSATECRYQCSANFYWYNSACVQCYDNAHCNTGAGEICSNNQCTVPIPAESCSTGSQSRDRCSNARIIGRSTAKTSSGYVISDDTCGASNRVDQSSGCWDAGDDHTYKIYLRAGENAVITLSTSYSCPFYDNTYWDGTLAIYNDAACGSSARVWCDDHYEGTTTYTAPADGWYIIVVDGSSAFDDEGDYTLTVKLQNCVTAGCNCP
jgi:hypothetical protein